MTVLKKVLAERFVPFLPPLLGAAKPEDQTAKQLSRAFSAFALHKLLNITPKDAAASVVDNFNDKGLDAIHYHAPTETLYLLQTKLKESEQFKQDEAQSFCTGIRLLLRQDFTAFNGNVHNRKAEIEGALDACTHIKLVVPYTGDGVSQSAIDALQVLLNDDDLDEERLAKQVDYYAPADITRDLLAEQAYPPVHTDIALQKHAKVENPRTTYYGIARLTDLVELHNDKGKALYERNIRYFLGGNKSDVNRAIKTTLHDDPASFFYLNNGVTAVCDDVEPKGKNPTSGARKFKVRGLSIINGAQTVASAAEFVRQHPGSLLVCCAAFHGVAAAKASERWPNLTLKKIPKMVLARCEWGHDDYSLNVANLPMAQVEKHAPAASYAASKAKKSGPASAGQGGLFGEKE